MRYSRPTIWLVACAVLTSLGGCSPALNWREVTLGSTKVMLPCKPDRAQRTVQLGGRSQVMEMVGCEADGALFAASRLEVTPPEQAALLAQWHRASMEALSDTTRSQVSPRPNAMWEATGQGTAPDRSVVQARFLWQAGSHELILLAVYAPRITSGMTEPFLIDLKLR